MTKTLIRATALVAALLSATVIGYRAGSGTWPALWSMAGHEVTQPTAKAERKILYYRNPMGQPDTSPVPKKDTMGMDYIPVYADEKAAAEEPAAGTVTISTAKLQRAGVRTELAGPYRLATQVRAPGTVKADERTLYAVSLRADSFIEKLHVNETGRHVTQGEPLFRIYSPDMVKVQVDYRTATDATGIRDQAGALQRLDNLDLPPDVVETLKRTRQPTISFDWPSPVSGFVLRKNALEGAMVKAGEEIYRIADLSSVWVIAEISEQDIGQVKVGQTAHMTFKAYPGEVFDGKVTFILHELETSTRTAQVRIELANPDHRIKHEMFADVVIDTGSGEPEALAVPASALIDSGNRQVVMVDLGDGRFEPRQVKAGRRDASHVAILEGLEAGENVVVSGNFLIDAESNLNAALSSFRDPAPSMDMDAKPMDAPQAGEKRP